MHAFAQQPCALAIVEQGEQRFLEFQRRARGRIGVQAQARDAQRPWSAVGGIGDGNEGVVAVDEASVEARQGCIVLRGQQTRLDRKSTRLNSSPYCAARMPASALNK